MTSVKWLPSMSHGLLSHAKLEDKAYLTTRLQDSSGNYECARKKTPSQQLHPLLSNNRLPLIFLLPITYLWHSQISPQALLYWKKLSTRREGPQLLSCSPCGWRVMPSFSPFVKGRTADGVVTICLTLYKELGAWGKLTSCSSCLSGTWNR